jgi:hypothetical protein
MLTSKASMAGFCSTAMKYPCWSMSVNTRAWRNMAPPIQLKPNVWNRARALRLKVGVAFIINREY